MGTTATAATTRTAPLRATRRPALLELRDIRHSYALGRRAVPVLRGVDLSVKLGEVVAVVGRSGSGKSTLMHIAGALTQPDDGQVLIDGEPLSSIGARARAVIRRRRIGFVFQSFHLLPGLDLVENVSMPLLLNGESGRAVRDKARHLLFDVGLGDRADHLPNELSGGELQRAAIARALVAEPALVLADEPTGNLDSTTADDIIELLLTRARARGAAMMIVTHDSTIADRADRQLTMLDGLLT